MPHRFEVQRRGKLLVFENYEDIPLDIDTVVAFLPEIPPEPHTDEQHKEIDQWGIKFDQLMERVYGIKTGSETR